ncbi:uncharacterized protein BT62DRAFT_924594 [Guyanagaster necrorhizus]|uniref:Uncharacterized protein n=1 Tax=Guyanagaster necrorhizus TaxID=856835 RepID=A0A9P8AMA1_9AGAR|nr:uncharacterized protein BT62DRAFT_924594 [Guyanagaster necrorhizus MCA 3950]KAG7439642.1 hypothetical protein BT62DRAFT_924594 [Guyanagaster necrorhizus MCA 3950]
MRIIPLISSVGVIFWILIPFGIQWLFLVLLGLVGTFWERTPFCSSSSSNLLLVLLIVGIEVIRVMGQGFGIGGQEVVGGVLGSLLFLRTFLTFVTRPIFGPRSEPEESSNIKRDIMGGVVIDIILRVLIVSDYHSYKGSYEFRELLVL